METCEVPTLECTSPRERSGGRTGFDVISALSTSLTTINTKTAAESSVAQADSLPNRRPLALRYLEYATVFGKPRTLITGSQADFRKARSTAFGSFSITLK